MKRGLQKFVQWAKTRSSPKDLLPIGIGAWLMKSGISSGNEAFVFISLYLFGLIPAWWADGGPKAPGELPKQLPPEVDNELKNEEELNIANDINANDTNDKK